MGYYCHGVSLVDSLATLEEGEVTREESSGEKSAAASTFSGLTGLSFNHITEELVVADYDNRSISVLSLSTGTLREIYKDDKPAGLQVSDDGNVVYASLPDSGKILAISLQDHTVKKEVATGMSAPWGMCLSSDGKKLFVAESGSSNVSVINLETSTKENLAITGGTGASSAARDVDAP